MNDLYTSGWQEEQYNGFRRILDEKCRKDPILDACYTMNMEIYGGKPGLAKSLIELHDLLMELGAVTSEVSELPSKVELRRRVLAAMGRPYLLLKGKRGDPVFTGSLLLANDDDDVREVFEKILSHRNKQSREYDSNDWMSAVNPDEASEWADVLGDSPNASQAVCMGKAFYDIYLVQRVDWEDHFLFASHQ